MENYLKILSKGLENIDIVADEKLLNKFKIYTDYLLEYNSHTNLTAITDKNDIATKHYLDSLSILKYINIENEAKIIDIGTGAGFPLLPIKIVNDNLNITLLDSLNKRIIFLQNLIKKLNINAEILHERAENLAKEENYRNSYDYVCVRAVASLNILIEYSIPFLKKGGRLIALKGEKVEEEIKEAKNALISLNSKIENIIDVEINNTNLNHKIIIIKKMSETCKKFPRTFSKIKKNPL